jgi:uncharacterized protein YbbK (DUF523 family)
LAEAVRYNGGDMRCDDDILQRWLREGRVVSVCPEVAGGLPVPRPRAEIAHGADGRLALAGIAKAFDANGLDVSAFLGRGAEQALERARAPQIRIAVPKEGSPSRGTGFTFDGSFTVTSAQSRCYGHFAATSRRPCFQRSTAGRSGYPPQIDRGWNPA